jgi:hypothetical protein
MTNSPIVSYNNTIKEPFTKRIKHHLKTAVERFQDVVSYEPKKLVQMPKKFRIVRRKKIVNIETIVATKNKWWLREMNQ